MARTIHKSQLELYVEAYLNKFRSTNNTRGERVFLKKAQAMITSYTTDSPCCSDEDATIDLFTPRDNTFTNTVRSLLFGIDQRAMAKSLARIIALLQKYIDDPCCD